VSVEGFDAQVEDTAPAATTEHPASPLANLRARREAALAELFLDLAVPNYLDELGVDLYVRFKPLPISTSTRLVEQARKSKSAERFANANAAALAAATVGIYYVHEGREVAFVDPPDPAAEWPSFDESVARLIGVSYVSPSALVRELYFTDEQVAATVTELQRWSEGEIRQRTKDERGN
jgi:hypothetical protein